MNRHDKIFSSLIGGALGDALGYSREFDSLANITRHLPGGDWRYADFTNSPSGQFDTNHRALISDDTQMTIATGRALVKATPVPYKPYPHILADELSAAYVTWSQHPDNYRAPGNACMRACTNMAKGLHWSDATDINTMGCGANMRVAPIALSHDLYESPIDLAYLSSAITHAHPAALASAALTVMAIGAAHDGVQGEDLLDHIIELSLDRTLRSTYPHNVLGDLWGQSEYNSPEAYLKAGYDLCAKYLMDAQNALRQGWKGQTDPCQLTGEAWIAPSALAGAMLCVAGLWDNPVQVLQRAAVSNGDSDSLAAIAGNIRGAGGVDWPTDMVDSLEAGPVLELHKLAEQL